MKHKFSRAVSAATLLSLLLPFGSSANAGTWINNWNYVNDAPYDSLGTINGSSTAGGTIYEIYGLAIKEDPLTNTIWVAINGNLPITGHQTGQQLVSDGRTFTIAGESVAWGDLFFDFTGSGSLKSASDTSSLFAVRFGYGSDNSLDFGRGVYKFVNGVNVAGSNAGYRNLNHVNDRVIALDPADRSSSMGDLLWNNSYFVPYTGDYRPGDPSFWNERENLIPTSIGSGDFVGDIVDRSLEELQAQGFDLNNFAQQGEQIFGFSFTKPLEFVGNYIATLLQECINDGIALLGRFAPPPPSPPSSSDCPLPLGQLNALPPTRIEGDTKIFEQVISGAWYDPPARQSYHFKALDGSLFTDILNFPCGIYARADGEPDSQNAYFEITVGDIRIPGQFKQGDHINFGEYQSILGDWLKTEGNYNPGVADFIISRVEDIICIGFNCPTPEMKIPPADSYCQPNQPNSFCIQLALNKPFADFEIDSKIDSDSSTEDIPEPGSIVGLAGIGIWGLGKWRSRRKKNSQATK